MSDNGLATKDVFAQEAKELLERVKVLEKRLGIKSKEELAKPPLTAKERMEQSYARRRHP